MEPINNIQQRDWPQSSKKLQFSLSEIDGALKNLSSQIQHFRQSMDEHFNQLVLELNEERQYTAELEFQLRKEKEKNLALVQENQNHVQYDKHEIEDAKRYIAELEHG